MSKNAVAYCVTGAYMQLTIASVYSIIKYRKSNEQLDILVMTDYLGGDDIVALRELPQWMGKPNVKVSIWKNPNIEIPDYKNPFFPKMTLWCLLLPGYFSSYENILYLDSDTILYDDVDSIFKCAPKDKAIAAVRDFYYSMVVGTNMPVVPNLDSTLVDPQRYCNSGMVLYNVNQFNNLVSPDKIISMANTDKYVYPDQTILNILCKNSLKILPFEFNYQKDDHWLFDWASTVKENSSMFNQIEQARKNVKIRHFVMYEKRSMPWEHVGLYDKWDVDFWNNLIELKDIQIRNNKTLGRTQN